MLVARIERPAQRQVTEHPGVARLPGILRVGRMGGAPLTALGCRCRAVHQAPGDRLATGVGVRLLAAHGGSRNSGAVGQAGFRVLRRLTPTVAATR